jgi:hypothetical protein
MPSVPVLKAIHAPSKLLRQAADPLIEPAATARVSCARRQTAAENAAAENAPVENGGPIEYD